MSAQDVIDLVNENAALKRHLQISLQQIKEYQNILENRQEAFNGVQGVYKVTPIYITKNYMYAEGVDFTTQEKCILEDARIEVSKQLKHSESKRLVNNYVEITYCFLTVEIEKQKEPVSGPWDIGVNLVKAPEVYRKIK